MFNDRFNDKQTAGTMSNYLLYECVMKNVFPFTLSQKLLYIHFIYHIYIIQEPRFRVLS